MAQSNVAGSYGKFSIDAAGAWTYTANTAHDEFVAGQRLHRQFTVASADGTATGRDGHHPRHQRRGGAVGSSTAEPDRDQRCGADISTGGTLTISDVDSAGDLRGAEQRGRQHATATFTIDAGGRLDLHGERRPRRVRGRPRYTDTFTVASADGTPTGR